MYDWQNVVADIFQNALKCNTDKLRFQKKIQQPTPITNMVTIDIDILFVYDNSIRANRVTARPVNTRSRDVFIPFGPGYHNGFS